jgi:predicted RNA-binding protein with RPS1 domain
VLAVQMINFMRKWFLVHISEIDGKYVENVQEYLFERKRQKNTYEKSEHEM